MKKHFSSVHEGNKPHKCEMCGTSFARKDALKTHITSVHEKIK